MNKKTEQRKHIGQSDRDRLAPLQQQSAEGKLATRMKQQAAQQQQ